MLEARYTSQFLQDLFLELDYDEQGHLSRRHLFSTPKIWICGNSKGLTPSMPLTPPEKKALEWGLVRDDDE